MKPKLLRKVTRGTMRTSLQARAYISALSSHSSKLPWAQRGHFLFLSGYVKTNENRNNEVEVSHFHVHETRFESQALVFSSIVSLVA